MVLGVSAQAQVHIQEVGLNGYVGLAQPNRVAVEISNPSPGPQAFTLRLSPLDSSRDVTPHTDYRVQLNGGETRVLDVPFYVVNAGKLLAQQLDSAGNVVSHSEKEASNISPGLVAVVCASREVCTGVAQAIRAGRTIEEQNAREQKLTIILLQDPPEHWFAYTPAKAVVVAGPLAHVAARDAISDYARLGGKVIVALDQAPRELLAEYRLPGDPDVSIGNGVLSFVSRAAGHEMEEEFSQEIPQDAELRVGRFLMYERFNSGWLMTWVGTHFDFPRLSWLLGWMGFYIVVIGLANFLVLRKLGKVELAWITVPLLAVLFGTVFYFLSVRGKMRHFALDQVSVCWMDDMSARGAMSHSVRVASPRVQDLNLQMPASSVLSSVDYDPLFRASDVADVWSEHRATRRQQVPDVTLDSAQHINMEMLRLSFRDLGFATFQAFPGTVSLQHGRLRNATGQNFSQAALVDFKNKEYYELGAVPAGAEVDPFSTSVPKKKMSREERLALTNPNLPFGLTQLIQTANFSPTLSEDYLVFMGLTDKPLLPAQLEGLAPERKNYTLFLVKVRRPQ